MLFTRYILTNDQILFYYTNTIKCILYMILYCKELLKLELSDLFSLILYS